jgi:LmbE family N-acetylglucosaminyl deacetylase
MVGLLDAQPGRPARVLALGADAAPLALALRARGHEVVAPRPDQAEEALAGIARSSPGTLDAVLAVGFLERLRWDRWTLQQVHRALRDEGKLLLIVPDLYSLKSLLDPRYVAAKLAKVMPRPGRGAGSQPKREAVRSYGAARLRATLERLGYQTLRWSGLAMRPAQGLAGAGGWPPTHHMILARRRSAAQDATAAPDPSTERRRFEAEHQAFLSLRERWRHPAMDGVPRALEPERFAGARALVLAPHPDDEIIGCGGTLLRLMRAGARVTVLQATDGSASASLEDAPPAIQRTIRLDEAHAVAAAAGFEPPILWSEDNRAFRMRDDLVARLRATLREIGPALVFTPFVADIHADHQTLNRILAAALAGFPEGDVQVLGYEVWSLAPANLWCDVSSCMRDVERLLLLYETAMKVDDFIHMCSTRNRYHALTLGGGPGYAEAFHATGVARFRELVERVPR